MHLTPDSLTGVRGSAALRGFYRKDGILMPGVARAEKFYFNVENRGTLTCGEVSRFKEKRV